MLLCMQTWHRAILFLVAAVAAGGGSAMLLGPIPWASWWAGEISLDGTRRFDPGTPDRDAVSRIDFERVHAELWPTWLAAVGPAREVAWEELQRSVQDDSFLVARLETIHRLIQKGPARNANRLLYQVWAWNHYLDLLGAPWRLSAGIHVNADSGAVFYVKSYRVISDTPTRVGDGHWRTRVVQRVDDLNVMEGYLGLTSDHEEGALVVAERVAAFALERVWPLLDPTLDPERRRLDTAFAEAIRREARQALAPEDHEVLRSTAADRFWLERAVEGVHDRARCGSQFRIGVLPFDGLNHEALQTVRRFAAATYSAPCPDVTREEALAMVLRSHRLQSTERLRPALEALTAWVARAVAIHEARHAADDAMEEPMACVDCPDHVTGVTRLEVSAYLASFTDERSGVVALLQACAVEEVDAAGRGQALRFLSERLSAACVQGPPASLQEQARALELSIFQRSDSIQLDPAFPARLPLERAHRASSQHGDLDSPG